MAFTTETSDPSDRSTASTAAGGAGWFPDPLGEHYARWWNGEAWTTTVHDGNDVVGADHGHQEAPAHPFPADPEPTYQEPTDQEPVIEPVGRDADPAPPVEPESSAAPRPKGAPVDGADPTAGPGWRATVGIIAVGAVVFAALAFGWTHRSTAAQWKERAEELESELDTSLAANDTFENALNSASSERARLTDSQEAFAELELEIREVTRDIYDCANALTTMAVSGADVDQLVTRAQDKCNTAVARAEGLASFLDALQV